MVLRTFSHRATFVPACQHNPCFAHLGSCDEVALMTNLERFPVHRNNPSAMTSGLRIAGWRQFSASRSMCYLIVAN